MKFSIFILMSIACAANAFWIHEYSEYAAENENTTFIDSLQIKPSLGFESDGHNFPSEFSTEVDVHGEHFSNEWRRLGEDDYYPVSTADVFFMLDGQLKQFVEDNEGHPSYALYEEKHTYAFATLIRNNETEASGELFRGIFTLFSLQPNTVFDILPYYKYENSELSLSYIAFRHALRHREIIDDIHRSDENGVSPPESSENTTDLSKRADSGPAIYNVETLLVTDSTVFDDHKRMAYNAEDNTVIANMKIYFGHFFNGVNQRYQNTLANNNDFKISIVLKDIMIYQKSTDTPWTNNIAYGKGLSYKGREVLVASKVLASFAKNNTFAGKFEYDHAVAVFNKELITNSDATLDDSNAGVTGLAYLPGVCTDTRYSIAEEVGAFAAINTVAHEIGHNLGSDHDGTSAASECSTDQNYVMTPSMGVNKANFLNEFLFSSCSVRQFQSTLSKSTYNKCLLNTPTVKAAALSPVYPGLLYTPNDQCRQKDNSSRFCLDINPGNLCTTLMCTNAGGGCGYTTGIGAAEGTPCASGKMCIQGVCTDNALAPVTDCPFEEGLVSGSQIGESFTTKTCTEYFSTASASTQKWFCGYDFLKAKCCKSCLNVATATTTTKAAATTTTTKAAATTTTTKAAGSTTTAAPGTVDLSSCVDNKSWCSKYSTSCYTGMTMTESSNGVKTTYDFDTTCTKTCVKSCPAYIKSLGSCVDNKWWCSQMASSCSTGSTVTEGNVSYDLFEQCKATCQLC